MKEAILTCDQLTVYSPNYRVKIIKRGHRGFVIDNSFIKIFCISHDGITFSYKIENNDFEYTDKEYKRNNIDVIKNFVTESNEKDELYTLLSTVLLNNSINIYSKDMYAKAIHNICSSKTYKSDILPIPCDEYSFYELIEEWYTNNESENDEELLTKILQILLFECEANNIDINKLFV